MGSVDRGGGRVKKGIVSLLAGALCLCLAGCTVPPPERAADGSDWDKDWITIGGVLGVDTPAGLIPQENNEALAANGMYYATWSMGEGEPYTNADGEEAQLYEGQVYLLLSGHDAAEKAEETVSEWLEMASAQYQVEHTFTDDHCNGQTYSIITYACGSDTNPYARGASAFGVYRNFAISVEILCQEKSDIDPRAVMASFLANCHYAMP